MRGQFLWLWAVPPGSKERERATATGVQAPQPFWVTQGAWQPDGRAWGATGLEEEGGEGRRSSQYFCPVALHRAGIGALPGG